MRLCTVCPGPREPVFVGFLCRTCWDALAGLRERWAEDGRTLDHGRQPAHTAARVETYRAKVAAGVPLFEEVA